MKKPNLPAINPLRGEPTLSKDFEKFRIALWQGLSKSLNTPVENILWKYKSDSVIDKICSDLQNNIYTKNIDEFSLLPLSDFVNGKE